MYNWISFLSMSFVCPRQNNVIYYMNEWASARASVAEKRNFCAQFAATKNKLMNVCPPTTSLSDDIFFLISRGQFFSRWLMTHWPIKNSKCTTVRERKRQTNESKNDTKINLSEIRGPKRKHFESKNRIKEEPRPGPPRAPSPAPKANWENSWNLF